MNGNGSGPKPEEMCAGCAQMDTHLESIFRVLYDQGEKPISGVVFVACEDGKIHMVGAASDFAGPDGAQITEAACDALRERLGLNK